MTEDEYEAYLAVVAEMEGSEGLRRECVRLKQQCQHLEEQIQEVDEKQIILRHTDYFLPGMAECAESRLAIAIAAWQLGAAILRMNFDRTFRAPLDEEMVETLEKMAEKYYQSGMRFNSFVEERLRRLEA